MPLPAPPHFSFVEIGREKDSLNFKVLNETSGKSSFAAGRLSKAAIKKARIETHQTIKKARRYAGPWV
jgi:hypothetical protein